VCEIERQNQPRSNKRKRAQKKRVISATTATAAGASNDVPQ
jgi:hypothetical protein